ncbi:NAD+ synthase [bacterium]|nr:NAD+ synthase [bacterium]
MENYLELDIEKVTETILVFISREIHLAGLQGAVIGLSGGIDSTVTAFLCARALGAEKVIGLNMPYKLSDPNSLKDAKTVAEALGIRFFIEDLTDISECYFDRHKNISNVQRGNFLARLRMIILYDYSYQFKYMVVGGGNRTERLLGYTTIWGDMACGIAPLGGLLKTQVRQLGRYLKIPQAIQDKPPSADLWPDQTDEGELGLSYREADLILHHLFDKKFDPSELIRSGFDENKLNLILEWNRKNDFKCRMPRYPRIENYD